MIKVQILDSGGSVTDTLEVDPYRFNRIMGKWQYLDQIEEVLIKRSGEEIAKDERKNDEAEDFS